MHDAIVIAGVGLITVFSFSLALALQWLLLQGFFQMLLARTAAPGQRRSVAQPPCSTAEEGSRESCLLS